MLTSLHIKNFRGFRDLRIEPLKRINLITGQNNTGKTGVLEASALLLDETSNQNLAINLPNLFRITRGEYAENFWKWLFNNEETSKTIEITAASGPSNGDHFGIELAAAPKFRFDKRNEAVKP